MLRTKPLILGFCLFFLPVVWLNAQTGFFNFSYNGPHTLSVGPTCSSMLQGNVPDPVVSSTVGATITMSMFDAAASGFNYADLFTSGTTAHVFWFVKDDAGHSHTYEYFINFVDNTPPTFDLTGVFNPLEFSSIAQVPTQTALPVTDNCTPVINQTFSQTPGPALCQSGSFIRTWTATDANQNTATYTQTIIIYKDSLPPQITGYPQNGSASCEQLATAYPIWLAAQVAAFSATDASGIASITNNGPATFPPGCKAPLTVRFKAVDKCQFQQNVDVVFTTSDNEGPVVIKAPKDTVAYCSQSDNELTKLKEWISTKAYSQVFDSCSYPLNYTMQIGGVDRDSAQVVAAFLASFANGCGQHQVGTQNYNKVHGFVSVKFIVKDACGNPTDMGYTDFGAIDTLPPVLTGNDVLEQCGGGNDLAALQAWINAHGNATVTEDCSSFTWTNFSFVTSSGQTGNGNFNSGPYPSIQANNCTWFVNVTFRATDDCGNSNTVTLRWSIEDTQVPVIAGLQPVITVYCPNPLPTIPAATVTDNCDANLNITFTRLYKDSICAGSYTVETTWKATDDCGNMSSMLQIILVSDTTKPVFTLVPANQTFRCDTFVLPPVPVMGVNIMASDGCSPVTSISTATVSLQNPDPAVCGHYMYNIIRTFTAMDQCGNSKTASQIISVVDNLGPVPGGILDTTALCSALTPFPAPIPSAMDACSGLTAPPVNTGQTPGPGGCAQQYSIAVHWTATDVCGNPTDFDQLVHVIDTVPPVLMNIPSNITVECNAIPAPPAVNSFNATDNCDNAPIVVLVQTEIRNPDTTVCAHWTNYVIKREWTVTDNCENARTYTQLIQIEDTTPPSIVTPSAITFPNDLNDCGANVMIPAPLSITDVCSDQLAMVVLRDTAVLVLPPGAPPTSGVDTVVFQWTPPNLPPMQPVAGNGNLTIFIDQADAEGPLETLQIIGENNTFFTNTNRLVTQCGSGSTMVVIPASQLNAWMSDGTLTITLVPNGVNGTAINLPPCTGLLNRVRAELSYSYSGSDVPIGLTYTVDNGNPQNYPPAGPAFLSAGTHTVVYTATDCAGNSSTSSVQITVNDTQAPVIGTPANINAFTGQNNCESIITLPFPAITENCAMSASLSLASAVLPVHFEVDNDIGIVALDISPTLSGLIPNAVGTGILKIRYKGDNGAPGEFFNVYDETGTPLGTTGQGPVSGECVSFYDTIIPVTALQINTWALGGGNTFFYLESNRDQVDYTDFVGNCAPLLPNGTDGISQVQVVLEYSYAVINYAIKNTSNQVVSTGIITGANTKDTLPPGNYTVMYTTMDNAGLTAMTSFAVTVRDTVRPKALCKPTFIVQVDPSGASTYTLLPATINNNSFDNCSPTPSLTYSVTPNSFSCSLAGTNTNATLTVRDTSGNTATCHTLIGVTTTPPAPIYIPVCENYALKLFAEPPSLNPYQYQWSGPNGYSSNEQNPVVTNNANATHNGTYCVTITGASMCTSSACVVVELAILGEAPVLEGNGNSFCPGQIISLKTKTYNGINVSYQWFMDATPAPPVVVDTTMVNNFNVPPLPPGTYTFYLKIYASGCNTALSNSYTITVHPTPPADAQPETQQKCEGDAISLQSPTPPTGGLTYAWTGPFGFNNQQQNPVVTPNAVLQNAGKYILVTQQNGCFSNPDTVMVMINPKPPKPVLSGMVNVCAGQMIKLVCTNITTAFQWVWTDPQGNTYVTTMGNGANELKIPNANAAHEGNWSVFVISGGCFSDESAQIYVDVHEYPVVMANSNAPICKDSLLMLSATFISAEQLSFCWTFPDNSMQCLQNLTVPNGASGTYQVVASTSLGCTGTASVQVTNVIPPNITFIANNAPLCCDGTTDATLTATVLSIHTPFSYFWTGPPAFGTSTLPNPVIPDVCMPYNGQYTLIVKDSFGCPSIPATTAINIQAPPATPFLTVNDNTVCAGDSVLFSFTNGTTGALYTWHRPGAADTTTTVPFLKILNAQPGQSGLYTVIATAANGTCSSGISTPVSITIFPVPAPPAISSNSPVCVGSTLSLCATNIPGAIYQWMGPSFSDPTPCPERSPVTPTMAGLYTLNITKDGCTSRDTSLTVVVAPNPGIPEIAPAPAAICIDAPVTAFLNILNPVNGMIYTWEDAATGIDLQSSTATSLNLGMANVLVLGPGSHMFRVFATTSAQPGCSSPLSLSVKVNFDTIPDGINAFAGIDRFACVSNPITLMGTPPMGSVTGTWSQFSAPPLVTFDNANAPNATFVGKPNTVYLFQWSLSNGACMDYDRDTVQISAQEPEAAVAMPDTFYCTPNGIQLHATQGTTSQGMWTQLPGQAQIGIVIDDPNDPNTTISGKLNHGQSYAFYWEIGNIGCGTSIDPVIVYVYSPKPNAGPVQFICDNQNCADLGASTIANFETGRWTSHDPDLNFTNPGSTNTTVCGLKPGKNTIFWTINEGKCGDQSRDTVEVYFELSPTAFDDTVMVAFGDTAHFNVLLNDILPTGINFTILTPPMPGSIIDTIAPGSFVYRPQSGFSGTDAAMTYSVCNTNCPSSCFIATVRFVVGGAPACFIPSIITPNGDGFNDQFKIPQECTLGEGASEVEVTIFNQWGDHVFHAKPYLNDWGGTYNTEELPAGTYYYVVKLSPQEKALTGFLLIQR